MSEKKKKRKLSLILTSIVVVAVIATVIVVVSGKMPGLSGAEEGQNKLPVEVTDEKGKAEIIEKQDASYERWLAAGMVTAVSMQYPDFEIQHIYLASENDIGDKMESEGAYVLCMSDGKQICIYSEPLEEERSDKGTIDLYTKDLSFATFEETDVDESALEQYTEVSMDDLSELISQSMLVSLYEH